MATIPSGGPSYQGKRSKKTHIDRGGQAVVRAVLVAAGSAIATIVTLTVLSSTEGVGDTARWAIFAVGAVFTVAAAAAVLLWRRP